jgi:hypothetical protein
VIEFELVPSPAHADAAVELRTAARWTFHEVLTLCGETRAPEAAAQVRVGCTSAELADLAGRFTREDAVPLTVRELHIVHRAFSLVGAGRAAEQAVHEATGLFRAEIAEIADRLAAAAGALDAAATNGPQPLEKDGGAA